MEDFILYVGKAALALGAFYLAYLVLFQHQKHFLFNRIYLPVSFLVSLLIPLITFTKVNYIQPVPAAASDSFAFLPEAAVVNEPQFTFEWYHYLLTIYALGIVVFLLNLLIGHLKAMSIIRFSRLKELFGARVNLTQKDVHPFSFFSRIVLSEKTLNNPNLKMIVDHEMIHVRELHTLDILFAELLFLFQWFNPFAWLIRDAMRNNLEYLTDHQVAQNHNAEAYQLAMVGLAHKKGVAPFLTALNGSQLKNRIIMMKKKTENRYSLLKQLIVLPMLAILVMGLSNKEVRTEVLHDAEHLKVVVDGVELPANHPDLIKLDFANGFNGGEVINALGLEDKVVANALSFDKNPKEDGVYYIQTSDYVPGTNIGFEQAVNGTLTSELIVKGKITNNKGEPLSAVAVLIEGTTTGTISDFSGNYEIKVANEDAVLVFNMLGYEFRKVPANKEKINVVLNKSDIESQQSPHGVVVKAEHTVSGKITNEDGEGIPAVAVLVKGTKAGTMTDLSGNYELKSNKNSTLVFRMIGCAEKEVSVDGKSEIDVTLKTGDSGKMDELKVVGFGDRKTEAKSFERVSIPIPDDSENAPLYIVDGKPVADISSIPSENIEAISVLKGPKATALYGTVGGRNGVVLLTTKAAATGKSNKFSFEAAPGEAPLYIVDGKEVGNVEKLSAEEIESISVLKDKSATSLYGDKAKNGVILITTKSEEITSNMELRKFIAKNIKYPSVLVDASATGVSKLYVKVNSNGSIVSADTKVVKGAIPVDEVVVVAYKPENAERTAVEDIQDRFDKEAKRVIQQLPKINIPGFKGETIVFTLKFMLQ